jgi:flagellar basal body-associated protein FliL
MKKRIIFIILAMLFIASTVVFAYNFCFFANGVSVSVQEKSVFFKNESDEGANVPHMVYFEDGTSVGPKNTYVPAKSSKTDNYSKKIKDVQQCW